MEELLTSPLEELGTFMHGPSTVWHNSSSVEKWNRDTTSTYGIGLQIWLFDNRWWRGSHRNMSCSRDHRESWVLVPQLGKHNLMTTRNEQKKLRFQCAVWSPTMFQSNQNVIQISSNIHKFCSTIPIQEPPLRELYLLFQPFFQPKKKHETRHLLPFCLSHHFQLLQTLSRKGACWATITSNCLAASNVSWPRWAFLSS